MRRDPPLELPAPESPPPLLVPDWPLPPYRYVPGLGPHPFRSAAGHLYTDGRAPAEQPWDPAQPWRTDRRWLRGIDLYNQRYLWEAHEAWEALWHHAPRGSAEASLLQGLIQAAAGLLKRHMGEPAAAERLLVQATRRLEEAERLAGPHLRGIGLSGLRAALTQPGWPIIELAG